MKLVVVGKEDVDIFEKWVREKFENVFVRMEGKLEVGRDGVRVVFDESLYGKE